MNDATSRVWKNFKFFAVSLTRFHRCHQCNRPMGGGAFISHSAVQDRTISAIWWICSFYSSSFNWKTHNTTWTYHASLASTAAQEGHTSPKIKNPKSWLHTWDLSWDFVSNASVCLTLILKCSRFTFLQTASVFKRSRATNKFVSNTKYCL